MRVFISYAREDQQAAQRLHDDLSSVPGLLPWLDTHELLPGDDWKDAIVNAMHECRFVILLMSCSSVTKDGFVQKEVRDALALLEQKPPGQVFLIPTLIEFCEPRFSKLRTLHWADLVSDWGTGVSKIIAAVKREQAREVVRTRAADALQQAKNKTDAQRFLADVPPDLQQNLVVYAEWLWNHDYWIYPYAEARASFPNWTKQAKSEWLEQLYDLGFLNSSSPFGAEFTDVGLELLGLLKPIDDECHDIGNTHVSYIGYPH